MATKYAESYLYSMNPEYEKKLVESVLKADRLDQNSPEFDDIVYEFKHRQLASYMQKIFLSPNVVLISSLNPLPSQFSVFVAKDLKSKNQLRVFMDVSRVIRYDNVSGKYACVNIDQLIAMLISAVEDMAFVNERTRPQICTGNIKRMSMQCWASLFTHIIDYLHKISLDKNITARCKLLACMYFCDNMLGEDDGYKKMRFNALQWCGVSEREEQIILRYLDDEDADPFKNIKTFVIFVGKVLKIPTLSVDAFVERWLFLYGVKTVFALEYWPTFAAMITDAYTGCFINNQKTIEKVCGNNMVMLAKDIIDAGGKFV